MADHLDLLKTSVTRAGAVRVRNVINPLLWLCGVSTPTCLAGAYAFHDQIALAAPILAVGLASPLATLAAYAYLLFRDPDRLHSEEFLIAQQVLLTRKGVGLGLPPDRVAKLSNPEPFEGELDDSE